MRFSFKKLKNEQGYMLFLTLAVLAVISIIGLSALLKSQNTLKTSTNERTDQSLYYIAEAGLVEKQNEVENTISTVYEQQLKSYKNSISNPRTFEEEVFYQIEKELGLLNNPNVVTVKNDFENLIAEGKPRAEITVGDKKIIDEYTRSYTITSVGKVDNERESERTVTKTITVSIEEDQESGGGITIPPGVGIYAKNNIELTNGTIEGDIIFSTESCSNVKVSGNPSVIGTFKFPQQCASNNMIDAPTWWINQHNPKVEYHTESYDFPLPEFPTFPTNYPTMADVNVSGHKVVDNGNIKITDYRVANYTLTLDQNYTFKNIEFNSNRKLTLDIGNRDISIVVDNITGSGHLDVKGTGTLTIYLKGDYNLAGHFNSSGANVTMYVDSTPGKTKTIKSSSYADFIANIYAKDANIELVGSGKIYGHIVTGGQTVKFSGATSGTTTAGYAVYAPNAYVELVGSGTVVGSVVANQFKTSGGAKVTAPKTDISDHPIFSGGGGSSGGEKKYKTTPIISVSPTQEIN